MTAGEQLRPLPDLHDLPTAQPAPWGGFAESGIDCMTGDRGRKTIADVSAYLEFFMPRARRGQPVCSPDCAQIVRILLRLVDLDTRTCRTSVRGIAQHWRDRDGDPGAPALVQALREATAIGLVHRNLSDTRGISISFPWRSVAEFRALIVAARQAMNAGTKFRPPQVIRRYVRKPIGGAR